MIQKMYSQTTKLEIRDIINDIIEVVFELNTFISMILAKINLVLMNYKCCEKHIYNSQKYFFGVMGECRHLT